MPCLGRRVCQLTELRDTPIAFELHALCNRTCRRSWFPHHRTHNRRSGSTAVRYSADYPRTNFHTRIGEQTCGALDQTFRIVEGKWVCSDVGIRIYPAHQADRIALDVSTGDRVIVSEVVRKHHVDSRSVDLPRESHLVVEHACPLRVGVDISVAEWLREPRPHLNAVTRARHLPGRVQMIAVHVVHRDA